MEIGPKAHFAGLLAIAWAGSGIYAFLRIDSLGIWLGVSIWGAVLLSLLIAIFVIDRKERARRSPAPMARLGVSTIYGIAACLLTCQMIQFLSDGYFSYLAASFFVLGLLLLAIRYAKGAICDFKISKDPRNKLRGI